MKKVTTLPIGLGMNHLEQEIAACHLWNHHIEASTNPDEWVNLSDWESTHLFRKNPETGLSLENKGFIEVSQQLQKFRFTPKAIELLEKFTQNQ